MSRVYAITGLIGLVIWWSPVATVAQECNQCHKQVKIEGVHADMDCSDCHSTVEEIPHPKKLPRVDCNSCHEDVGEKYIQHGMAKAGESDDVPTCSDCHGTHQIFDGSDRKSKVHPANLPDTCATCHSGEGEGEHLDSLGLPIRKTLKLYKQSVHGKASAGDKEFAATCNDCHSNDGDAHQILPPGDPKSLINHFHIPDTCGKCHEDIAKDYWAGIHGRLTKRGEVDSPICTTCHGEHAILKHDDPSSPVSANMLANSTCTPCHESTALNEKYDLPAGRMRTFVDSYHGLKSRTGDETVANCASCHEAHRILAAADPSSSINPNNLQKTCGECHKGISAGMATIPIHSDEKSALATTFQWIYIVAITVIIGGMILHWLIDLFRSLIAVIRQRPSVRRMTPSEVIQHLLLALSFSVLVLSGFALRFYDSWWTRLIFGHEGGYWLRGVVHRVAAVFMVVGAFWHLFFLFTRRGRQFVKDMRPGVDDFVQFWRAISINLGGSGPHPEFGRFSYVEKAEYWALIWGTAVMALTGIVLWFDNFFINMLGKGFMDVFLVVHYYEAWLAFLAIMIWHMYATVFRPGIYPMNPSWITGRVPKHMYEEEHGKVDLEEVKPGLFEEK